MTDDRPTFQPGFDAIDPDFDRNDPRQRRELRTHPVVVLATISAGGVLGALARYGVGEVLPHQSGAWPWSTLLINITGAALIGVLMVLVTEVWVEQRLIRPFLGVGVLGGYTTFSTAMVDVHQMIAAGSGILGLAYWLATLAGALIAVALTAQLTHWVVTAVRRSR